MAPCDAKYMGTPNSWYGERVDKIILTGTYWESEVWYVDYICQKLNWLTKEDGSIYHRK